MTKGNFFRPEEVEAAIGYRFKDRSLMRSALAHKSYTNELKINRFEDYERLEFLGDAVLELVVSDYLFKKFKSWSEGDMTQLRASLVCEPALANVAREIGLPSFMLLGRGEEAQGSRERDSIVSDVFEALTGAIYLDGGMEAAKAHIRKYVLKGMDDHKQAFYDAKTELLKGVQKRAGTLEYRLLSVSGPDHRRIYEMEAVVNGQAAGKGRGSSKKAAEQDAAHNAIISLKESDEWSDAFS